MASRIDRLAAQLSLSNDRRSPRVDRNGHSPTSRVAVDLFDEDHSSTDVEEGWSKAPDDPEVDGHTFLDDQREDLDLDDDPHEHAGIESLRKVRLKLLAGMVWAEIGEPDAIVKEVSPNELSIAVQDLSWKIKVGEDGRVTISGFDSGSEQFVGKLPDQDAEFAISKISSNIHQLISDDIDNRSTPPEPPVHFGPDETPGESAPEDMGTPPPVAPEGDQGVPPPETPLPPDMGAPPAAPQPGAFPPPQPGAFPPAAPQPGAFPPPPQPTMPMASRRARSSRRASWRREASARMDEVSNQLRSLGESLGEDGEETFHILADRVDRVVRMIDQSVV